MTNSRWRYLIAPVFGAAVSLAALYGSAHGLFLAGVLAAPGAGVAMLLDLPDVHGGNGFFRIMVIANFVIYSLIFLTVAKVLRRFAPPGR